VTIESIAPYLAFLREYRYAVVFVGTVIDATGVPFPGRLVLAIAGALSTDGADAAWLVVLAVAGTVVGDHVLYLLGWLGGDRVLSFYCRWTLGSARCIQHAQDYFRRFGGMTIVIGRFVGGVRIFAMALAGSGGILYYRFLLFDVGGAVLWAATFVLLGYVLGERAGRILEDYGDVALVLGLTLAVALTGVIAYRIWKRRRHKPATMRRARAGGHAASRRVRR
jgi:membrane protein DedA with SNARE-associated domain